VASRRFFSANPTSRVFRVRERALVLFLGFCESHVVGWSPPSPPGLFSCFQLVRSKESLLVTSKFSSPFPFSTFPCPEPCTRPCCFSLPFDRIDCQFPPPLISTQQHYSLFQDPTPTVSTCIEGEALCSITSDSPLHSKGTSLFPPPADGH